MLELLQRSSCITCTHHRALSRSHIHHHHLILDGVSHRQKITRLLYRQAYHMMILIPHDTTRKEHTREKWLCAKHLASQSFERGSWGALLLHIYSIVPNFFVYSPAYQKVRRLRAKSLAKQAQSRQNTIFSFSPVYCGWISSVFTLYCERCIGRGVGSISDRVAQVPPISRTGGETSIQV